MLVKRSVPPATTAKVTVHTGLGRPGYTYYGYVFKGMAGKIAMGTVGEYWFDWSKY